MSRISSFSGTFEKRVNDGDYGNERCELSASVEVEDGEDEEDVAIEMLTRLRRLVIGELLQSENLRVRRALKPDPRLCSECQQLLGDADDFVHEPCRRRRAERQEAEEDARRERWKAPVVVGAKDEDLPF